MPDTSRGGEGHRFAYSSFRRRSTAKASWRADKRPLEMHYPEAYGAAAHDQVVKIAAATTQPLEISPNGRRHSEARKGLSASYLPGRARPDFRRFRAAAAGEPLGHPKTRSSRPYARSRSGTQAPNASRRSTTARTFGADARRSCGCCARRQTIPVAARPRRPNVRCRESRRAAWGRQAPLIQGQHTAPLLLPRSHSCMPLPTPPPRLTGV
jgi:hypothetical protein